MNNKKMNKKGFTIVELVIVIAVIAILAGVMIPTFGGIIDKANESKVFQAASAAYKEAYGVAISDGKIDGDDAAIVAGEYTFTFTYADANNPGLGMDELDCVVTDANNDGWTVSVEAGVVKVEKGNPAAGGGEG